MKTWTDADLERILAESCERSGVPIKVTDPVVLARAAALAKVSETKAEAA